jgi:hypothetical protein
MPFHRIPLCRLCGIVRHNHGEIQPAAKLPAILTGFLLRWRIQVCLVRCAPSGCLAHGRIRLQALLARLVSTPGCAASLRNAVGEAG